MSIIYSFLQKRKMHESNHGYLMVFTAYVLSALMLVLGSDVFYNIKSSAAGVSEYTQEETQHSLNLKHFSLKAADITAQIPEAVLINPYGLTDTTTESTDILLSNGPLPSDNTVWFLGNEMDEEDFDQLMEQMGSLEPVKLATKKSKDTKEKASISSLSVNQDQNLSAKEAVSSEYDNVTGKEVAMLQRIVQAEAGGEDMIGKILIVNVIMNRVISKKFPDNIKGVIFQNDNGKYQFSPVGSERYYSVKVSSETEKAVERALSGEDYSKGALYFVAKKRTSADKARWFDQRLDWLFGHGGHDFYKNK